MTDRRNPDPDDDAVRLGPSQRWQHPSEVGLAVRGRTDRRRSTILVTGLLLGGVSLLVSGVLLGSMDHGEGGDDLTEDRIEHAVVNVVVVEDGISSTATGLVIDRDGHVAVRAGALRDADEIWARCADARMDAATVIAVDEDEDLAVLRLSSPGGRPAEVSEAVPRPGMDVLAVDAVPGAVTTVDATVTASGTSTPPDRFHTELASSGHSASLVFDVHGHLMGMSSGGHGVADEPGASVVEVHSAAGMIGAAQRLLER